MSRSYKRNPIFKDKNSRFFKKLVHNVNKNKELWNGGMYKRSVQWYSICDHRWCHWGNHGWFDKKYKLYMK